RVSAARALATAFTCYVVSLMFLIVLNISQAVVVAHVAPGDLGSVVEAALLTEAPMATLGAAQGLFVLNYLRLYAQPTAPDPASRWRAIGLNVVASVALASPVTYLVVAAFDGVSRWSQPTGVRLPTLSDFVSRVPAAGLIALVVGVVITAA